MQQQEPDKHQVQQLIQSILLSSKNGIPLDRINREYKSTTNGENIPFRELGYGTLQQFLEDSKDQCKITPGPEGLILKGVSTRQGTQIEEFNHRQKSDKRPKPQRRPLNIQQSHWQPPVPSGYPAGGGGGNFRHGFRPIQQQQNNFRFNRNMDQPRPGPGSGRFTGRGPRGPGIGPPPNSRLRTPQNGPGHNGYPRYQQQNAKPMSQRLGPMNGNSPQPRVAQPSANYVKTIEDYFAQMNLGDPNYKTSKMEKKGPGKSSKKGGPSVFYATIRVNNQSFQTYPNEFNSEQEAVEAAAKMACEKLGLLSGSNQQPPSSLSPTPTSPSGSESLSVLVDRIFSLVENKTNGIWSHRVESEYQQAFGHCLPENWILNVERYQLDGKCKKKIHFEKPTPDRFIVMPFIEQTVADTAPINNNNNNSPGKGVMPAVPTQTIQLTRGPLTSTLPSVIPAQPKLPELVLPEDSLWDIYVTHIFSTVEICVRLLGDEYSTKFEDLITEMELHYYDADKIPQVTNPVIGRLYAAVVDNEWHRVEVVSVKGIDVTCYFIDHGGDHDVHNIRVLREIDPKFLTLAPQAKRVRLAGLEEYVNSPIAHQELTSAALARSLVGQVHTRENEQDVSLILFDTSGAELDININQTLLEKLRATPEAAVCTPPPPPKVEVKPEPVSPPRVSSPSGQELDLLSLDLASLKPLIPTKIPNEGDFFDVVVTLAASPSNFTVQPYQESSELERLMTSMRDFYCDETKRNPMTADDLTKDNFFAAMHTDGLWYRVKINSHVDQFTLAVKIVDYGDFSMVPLENLQPLWPQFRNLPIQAINATLADIVAVDGDWTVEDTVWFTRRVVNKPFVSIIKDITFDKIEETFRIGISLVDTTHPTTDMVIEKELVDTGKAVFLCI